MSDFNNNDRKRQNKGENQELSHWCSHLRKEIFLNPGQNFCKYCGKAVGKSKFPDKIVEKEIAEIEEKEDQFLQKVKNSWAKTQEISEKRALGIEVIEEIPEIKSSKTTDSDSNNELIQEITKKLLLASEKYARIQISEITRSFSTPASITTELIKEILIYKKMTCVFNENSGELIFDSDSIRRMIKSGNISQVPYIIRKSADKKLVNIQGRPLKSQGIPGPSKNEIIHLCSYLQKEIQLSSDLNFCKYCGEKLSSEEEEFESVHWCSHYGKEILVESGLKFCKHCGKSLTKPEISVKESSVGADVLEPDKLEPMEQTKVTIAPKIRKAMDRRSKIQQKQVTEEIPHRKREVKTITKPKPKPYIERKSFRERLDERIQKRIELKTRDRNNEVEASYIGGILLGLIIGALLGGIGGIDFNIGGISMIMIGQGAGGILGGILGLVFSKNRTKKEKPGESEEKVKKSPVVT